MSCARFTWFTWLALFTTSVLCSSCVGRELVGSRATRGRNPTKQPEERCESRSIAPPEDVPPHAQALDLSDCTAPDDTLCSPEMAASFDTEACTVMVNPYSALWDVGSQRCAWIRWNVPTQRSSDTFTASDIELEQVNVIVATTKRATFELTQSTLAGVSFALLGPWTLRFVNNHQLDDVRVMAGPGAEIHIEGEDGARIAIDAAKGKVRLKDTSLQRTRIGASLVELDNSQVSDGAFTAESFSATQSALERVAVTAMDSLLDETSTSEVEFSACLNLRESPAAE